MSVRFIATIIIPSFLNRPFLLFFAFFCFVFLYHSRPTFLCGMVVDDVLLVSHWYVISYHDFPSRMVLKFCSRVEHRILRSTSMFLRMGQILRGMRERQP